MEIDSEFQKLLPPLSEKEFCILEADIKENGCRDPVVVWGDILVDGHNRYAICTLHGIPFNVSSMEFKDRDAAKNWIDNNQLGRRNLNAGQYTSVLGRMYNRHKSSHGGDRKSSGHGDHLKSAIAESIAQEHGVSEGTVRRAGRLVDSIEKLKVVEPDLEHTFTKGEAPSRAKIVAAAAVVDQDPEAAKELLHDPTKKRTGRGLDAAVKAINLLKRVPKDDPLRDSGFKRVISWIKTNR